MMSYKHQQTSVAHQRDLRCLQQSTRKHLQQQTHFLRAIQKLRLTFPCPKFSQKIYTTEAAMDDKNSFSCGQSKKQWLPRSCEDQNKNTRAMPTGKYWVFKLLDFSFSRRALCPPKTWFCFEENICSKLTLARRLFSSAV